MIFICSNHSSHAEYAINAIKNGKAVHIEKPHVTNYYQLEKLIEAMKENPNIPVFLGFNRPKTYLYKKLMSYVEKEKGPTKWSGAHMNRIKLEKVKEKAKARKVKAKENTKASHRK